MWMCTRFGASRRGTALALATALPLLVGACGGREQQPAGGGGATAAGGQTTGAAPAPAPAPAGGATTTAAPAGGATTTAAPAGAPPAGAPAMTPKMIALGDSIFHGRAGGGTCMTCHGPDAKGTQLAPNLTDNQWLHGDGSYQFIVSTVTKGVPTPKQAPAPMPPMGGAQLTPDQVNAVSAYVYSLSHPEAKRGK
jgi:mono/diheme cytochrome c family protein